MALQSNLKNESVAELSLREAVTLTQDRTLRDAVLAMRQSRLGCAIVIDADRKPVGMFTEAMLRHALCRNPRCIDETLSGHMATTFPWVRRSDSIETVLDAMELKNTRFVVVVDEQGTVTGLTGQKGLMEYVADHFPGEVMVQRIGSKPYPHSREGA